MRVETVIRKSLRMKSHRVAEVVEGGDGLVARIVRMWGRLLRCGGCGQPSGRIHSHARERRWKDIAVYDKRLELRYAPARVRCRRCGVRNEQLPWARRWQRITSKLLSKVAVLTRRMSWKECAEFLELNWKTVAAAVKEAVRLGLSARLAPPPRVIGIDEVSRRKGQKYLTLVYDLERRSIVWIGENRDRETMRHFFAEFSDHLRSVEVVCCDMWAAYVGAVRENLPKATILFDRFHVVAHMNRAVDEVRRRAWRELPEEERSEFKKTRFLWLSNPWNLQPAKRRQLSYLCRNVNAAIVRAYYLKEAFQRFWDYRRPGWSAPYLLAWLHMAKRSRLEPIVRFARMIEAHLEGILSWTNVRLSSGALEGVNNRVKSVSHRAFGFRTTENYVAAIWHVCGGLPLPA